jgi:hypothetical protein
MNRVFKSLLGVLLTGCCLAGQAQADIIALDRLPFSTWQSTPFQQQDKLYTYVSSTGISGGLFAFATNAQPTEDIHTVTRIGALFPGTFQLRYSVEIVGNSNTFKDASLGVNVTGALPNATVTESIYSDPFVTPAMTAMVVGPGGGSAGPNLIGGGSGLTKIWVQDDIVVGSNGQVNSFTNTFTQNFADNRVPEPASLALWGAVGAVGLIVGWRKRRRKASVGPVPPTA